MFLYKQQQHPLIGAVLPALHAAEILSYVLPSTPPTVRGAVLAAGHPTVDAIGVARQAL